MYGHCEPCMSTRKHLLLSTHARRSKEHPHTGTKTILKRQANTLHYVLLIAPKQQEEHPFHLRITLPYLNLFAKQYKTERHEYIMAMVAPTNNNDFSFAPPCSEECKVNEEDRRAVAAKPACALAERCVSACAAYGKVCPCSARIAAHYACDAVAELLDHSDLFAKDGDDETTPSCQNYVHLNAEDLVIHEKLGEGGFSHVNRCILKVGPEEGKEFAVKYLKRKAMVELHTFKHGAADLAIEARFLHQLDHINRV